MKEAVIVSGSRTAIGSFGGALKGTSVVELGALVMRDVLKRVNLKPDLNDQMERGIPKSLKDQGVTPLKNKAPIGMATLHRWRSTK